MKSYQSNFCNLLFYTICLCIFTIDVGAQICVGTAGEVTWSYWRLLPDDELGELYADEFYPDAPDGSRIINASQSPVNFDNRFGSLIRGFISVPVSEAVLFNITGDDDIRFYLSTDDSPDNLQMEAYINGHTQREQHDKYPEQNSRAINLLQGQHYYFELHHIEGGGGDHVSLWWKTSFTGISNWNFISSQYLSNIGCLDAPCPERGTSCNDGDATTTDDQEDGHCNCRGIPTTSNTCVGGRADLGAYYYDGIPGGDLSDLYEDPDFPVLPDRDEGLDILGIPVRTNVDSFGTLVQAYLTVPVSGNYQFNITSSDEAIFFMSSNDDPALKQSHQILTTSSTGSVEHDKFIYQSTAPLYLEQGQFYFIEINHKESSWQEHYSIFWKTPFTTAGQWKRIPSFYLYDYNCEIACISEGTPCDDGDPFTNNDAFDNNCNCVGVPCTGPDCNDPLASYIPYPECGLTDRLDNRADASWLSCIASASPIPAYGDRHWLQYDLGIPHEIWATHIWNYNVTGAVNEGFQSVVIDYSLDGSNWTTLGNYNWSLATGTDDYAGFMGPDFSGVKARYVLVTSLDDTGSCRGISKMTFAAQACGPEGSACDDGDPTTIRDQFDNDCNCQGIIATENNCLQDTLILGDSTLLLTQYSAIRFLESSSTIGSATDVSFVAGEGIQLLPGFSRIEGALLTLEIDDCTQIRSLYSPGLIRNLEEQLYAQPLIVFALSESDLQVIGFHVSQPGKVKLEIQDQYGNHVTTLIDNDIDNAGYYTKRISTKKLSDPHYQVVLTTANVFESEVLNVYSG